MRGKLVGVRPEPEPEVEEGFYAGKDVPGMVTTYSASAGDPAMAGIMKEARDRVAAMQARIDARHAKYRDLAVALAAARGRLGMTQDQVARRLGVPLHVVKAAERAGSLRVDRIEALLERYRDLEADRQAREPVAEVSGKVRAAK